MNARFRTPFSFAVIAFCAALTLGHASGQASKVVSEKPDFDDLPSPEFQGVKNKSFKPKDWLEIETKIKVMMAPTPPSKTLDKLTIKWYVAIKHPEKPNL